MGIMGIMIIIEHHQVVLYILNVYRWVQIYTFSHIEQLNADFVS